MCELARGVVHIIVLFRLPRPRIVCALLCAMLLAACGQGTMQPVQPVEEASSRDVTVRTDDGLDLSARVFGNGATGVILAHMYPSDATSWYGTAARLAAHGYTALTLNFRGYGQSEGSRSPSMADEDLRAAHAWLHDDGVTSVALVGASMGGTAALVAAAGLTPAAVVAISAPASFQSLDARTSAGDVHAPVLLIASAEDTTAVEGLRELSDVLPAAGSRVFDGMAHGTNLLVEHPEAEDVVLAFLADHAPPAPVG